MKKLSTLILLMGLILPFIACSGGGSDEETGPRVYMIIWNNTGSSIKVYQAKSGDTDIVTAFHYNSTDGIPMDDDDVQPPGNVIDGTSVTNANPIGLPFGTFISEFEVFPGGVGTGRYTITHEDFEEEATYLVRFLSESDADSPWVDVYEYDGSWTLADLYLNEIPANAHTTP